MTASASPAARAYSYTAALTAQPATTSLTHVAMA